MCLERTEARKDKESVASRASQENEQCSRSWHTREKDTHVDEKERKMYRVDDEAPILKCHHECCDTDIDDHYHHYHDDVMQTIRQLEKERRQGQAQMEMLRSAHATLKKDYHWLRYTLHIYR